MSLPNPPYVPSSLKSQYPKLPVEPSTPYTASVKHTLDQYILAVYAYYDAHPSFAPPLPLDSTTKKALQKDSLDDMHVSLYYELVFNQWQNQGTSPELPGGGIASAITTPFELASHIWGDLSSSKFWISAGEFIGGFLLIAIGTHAAVTSAKSPNSKHTLSQSVKKVLPAPAKTVVKAKKFKGVRSSSPQTKVSSSQANKALKQIAEYGKVTK